MKDCSRLWSILAILGAGSLPFCQASIRNEASVRNEFVQAMDRALGQKKNEEALRRRLGQLAVPANLHPGYQASQEGSNRKLEEYQDYAIDLTEYALKYIGCSNIRTWSDDLAAENNNNSVLKMDKFVVLRLCPRESCSKYNQYGCLEQFGDYLIPMETYLQTMAETYFTQYQEYCETCYECMNPNYDNDDGGNYQNYNNNGGNYNNYNNNGGNYNNYNNNGGRRLNDDAYNYDNNGADDAAGGDDDNFDQAVDCEYYSVCAHYQDACNEYSNLGFDLEDYFECAEFNIGNSAGYLGPHCASDGKTISMGIFNDEYCNDYSADISEVSSYMAVNQNDLAAYYSDNCISCLASVSLPLSQSSFGLITSTVTMLIYSTFSNCAHRMFISRFAFLGWIHIRGCK